MILQDRLEHYRLRGFQRDEAEILVLMERAASRLFTAFPDRFVLIGGATLVLLYESQRVSHDIDLALLQIDLPPLEEVAATIREALLPITRLLGVGEVEVSNQSSFGTEQTRLWVETSARKLFSVDLTRIGGAVLQTEIVNQKLCDDVQVIAPSANYLLLQKCEAFLGRAGVKARDAFDIHWLRVRGARLEASLDSHLGDFIMLREIDVEDIRARIAMIDGKRCALELKNVLPVAVYQRISKEDFSGLRRSLEDVFAPWL